MATTHAGAGAPLDGDACIRAQSQHDSVCLFEGETRTVLALQYVTDPRMSAVGRNVSTLKDGMAYFGFREVLRTAFAPGGPPARALPPRRDAGSVP